MQKNFEKTSKSSKFKAFADKHSNKAESLTLSSIYILILRHWRKKFYEKNVETGEIAQNVFFTICILKSFIYSHISIVVCSFFEFGMVLKWCIREWVKIWLSKSTR